MSEREAERLEVEMRVCLAPYDRIERRRDENGDWFLVMDGNTRFDYGWQALAYRVRQLEESERQRAALAR